MSCMRSARSSLSSLAWASTSAIASLFAPSIAAQSTPPPPVLAAECLNWDNTWTTNVESVTWVRLSAGATSLAAGTWYSFIADVKVDSEGYTGPDALPQLLPHAATPFADYVNSQSFGISSAPYGDYQPLAVLPAHATHLLQRALFTNGDPLQGAADLAYTVGDPLWKASPIQQSFGMYGGLWDTHAQAAWLDLTSDDSTTLDYNLTGMMQYWAWRQVQSEFPDPSQFFETPQWQFVEKFVATNDVIVTLQAIGLRGPSVNVSTAPAYPNPPRRLDGYPPVAPTLTNSNPLSVRVTGTGLGSELQFISPVTPGLLQPRAVVANQPAVVKTTGWRTGMQVRLVETATNVTAIRMTSWAGMGKWSFVVPNRPGMTFRITSYRHRRTDGVTGYLPWVAIPAAQQPDFNINP